VNRAAAGLPSQHHAWRRRIDLSMLRVLAAGILASAVAMPAAATNGSGLYGKVTRGPNAPVCTAGQPCYAAAPGITLTFTRNAKIVAHIKTGPGGIYRIALPPGSYTVDQLHAAKTMKPPAMKPLVVRVLAHHWKRQNFTIDTGIR
jgi:hypothetical protein